MFVGAAVSVGAAVVAAAATVGVAVGVLTFGWQAAKNNVPINKRANGAVLFIAIPCLPSTFRITT